MLGSLRNLRIAAKVAGNAGKTDCPASIRNSTPLEFQPSPVAEKWPALESRQKPYTLRDAFDKAAAHPAAYTFVTIKFGMVHQASIFVFHRFRSA
jgi:hypothetical protein